MHRNTLPTMTDDSQITVRTNAGVTVASLQGSSILDSQYIEAMRTQLFDLVEQTAPCKLILDISKVDHLSSAALGVLITLQENCRKTKGKLVICGATDGIAKLFELTKLNKLLKFADNEDDAMTILGTSSA